MNQQQTLALWEQGREAWNAWAQDMLARRKTLEESGEWHALEDGFGNLVVGNEKTKEWLSKAEAVFSTDGSPHTFAEDASFAGYQFPGSVRFESATFEGNANFPNATFQRNARFKCAKFKGHALFDSAKFKGHALFKRTTFEERANFESTTFEERALFGRTTFEKRAWFDSAKFKKVALFDCAKFEGYAGFDSATFNDITMFGNATFNDNAIFGNATFCRLANFKSTTFKIGALFDCAKFKRDALFDCAKFEGYAGFDSTTFSGLAKFERVTFNELAKFESATFKRDAWFDSATFKGNATFQSVVFEKPARFTKARFEAEADFQALQVSQSFSLDDAHFKHVPDFRQAHFNEAPLLDDVKIVRPTPEKVRKDNNGNEEPASTIPEKYRALKRLAIQGHDHLHEVEFFAEELRTRRMFVDKPSDPFYWQSAIFDCLSDYGRSILQPFLWWLFVTVSCAFLYLLTATATKGDVALQCVKGGGSQISSAIQLALGKGLLLPGIADRTLITQAYDCLYGGVISAPASAVLGLQTLMSAVLLFLLLLGIRNRFKLK